jgi:acyl-CoA reductase-like NAD-dependent aldehyde dehydrogenase
MSVVIETAADVLVARNPATGAEIGRVPVTPPEDVAAIIERARAAQAGWAATPWKRRREVLDRWRRILSRDADAWTDLIASEIGKPRTEAMGGDVVSTLDAIRWTVRNAGAAMAERRIGAAWQRMLLMPGGRCRWVPYGVIGMIGTWNYPLFLNAPPIAQALAAGNAVVWKASELAALCGARMGESLREAEVPEGLVAVVQGGPEAGRAVVESSIDKAMFTGGVENGRRVLAALGARGIPALAELSGFDPAIILPDAPRDSTVRALTWAAFVGCGQTCVAVKRVYVVGDPAPWIEAIVAAATSLRVGNPAAAGVDLGPMISVAARDRLRSMIAAAVGAGARVCTGGEPVGEAGAFLSPAVLEASSSEAEDRLAGVFGPVVVVRSFADEGAAVAAANHGPFALAASVWSRDRRHAEMVARRLQAGMVTINDAVTPTAHASAPFGGGKASGYGRTKGPIGLREFAQPQVVFARSPGGFRPQLFPYDAMPLLGRFFAVYRRIFHSPR